MTYKRLTEKVFIEIICKYKTNLENIQKNKEDTENEINAILKNFEEKTNHKVNSIKILKEKKNYKVLLEIK